VREFGKVKNSFVEKVLEIMGDCYNRINAPAVEIVDLYLFNEVSTMNAFLSEEKRNLGIGMSAFEASFFAIHDAWRGIPRIMVAYDNILTLPKLVRTGVLHHEVAHSVLHGSLEYYSFSIPALLLELEREGVVSRQIMGDLLYLVSIAVKDYEVTRLLYENSYVEDQVAYNKYFLEPSEEDKKAWKLARKNKTARLLVLVSLLKTTCCAAPLLRDRRYGGEMAESIARSMYYLPSELSVHLLRLIDATSKFGENTHENVDLFTKKIMDQLVIEDCGK